MDLTHTSMRKSRGHSHLLTLRLSCEPAGRRWPRLPYLGKRTAWLALVVRPRPVLQRRLNGMLEGRRFLTLYHPALNAIPHECQPSTQMHANRVFLALILW